eukprot:TRINITY_DN3716_c0_g2_i3.p1 TRINITY_DN3716_c0_g2~~TRINITY_DN3716_c0_g2_i3.p1  ORF type:complete len:319 (+),score=69.11 TRINITY_DN3716_c0_g2_i3:49-1005(+)
MATVAQGVPAVIATLSLLSWAFPTLIPFYTFIPANTITGHLYVWNLVTTGVVETNPVVGIFAAAVALWTSSELEPLWGTQELVRYLLISTTACSFCLFLMTLFMYMGGIEGLFYMYFGGAVGTVMALLVAMKQGNPDSNLVPQVPLRIKWLPIIFVTVSLLWEIVFPTHIPTDAEIGGAPQRGTHILHVLLSWFVSWFYLRFYQQINGGLGDTSNTFAFQEFFPEPTKAVVGSIANGIFKVVSITGFGKELIEAEEAAARKAEEENLFGTAPSSESDRRRQIALQALNDRLRVQKRENPTDGLDVFDIEQVCVCDSPS